MAVTAPTQEKNSEIPKMDEIDNLRKRIDNVDAELIELLAERKLLAAKIGGIKRDLGISIVDKKREREVYNKIKQLAQEHNLSEDYVIPLFRMIIQNSRYEQGNVADSD